MGDSINIGPIVNTNTKLREKMTLKSIVVDIYAIATKLDRDITIQQTASSPGRHLDTTYEWSMCLRHCFFPLRLPYGLTIA